jgi:hypothetical protein
MEYWNDKPETRNLKVNYEWRLYMEMVMISIPLWLIGFSD